MLCVCQRKARVKLFLSEQAVPRFALAVVEAPNARAWADDWGTIAGAVWLANGSDFVFASIPDRPGLVEEIRGEGYEVDDSDYERPRL